MSMRQWLSGSMCIVAIAVYGHFLLEFTGSEPIGSQYVVRETILFTVAIVLYCICVCRKIPLG